METQQKRQVIKTYESIKRVFRASHAKLLRLAVLKVKMLESLTNGFSYFVYKKSDGEIRDTIATLDTQVRPTYVFKNTKNAAWNEAMLVTAWDKDACMWRSFRVDRVVKLVV